MHSKAEDEAHHQELVAAVANPSVDLVAFEKEKIKGAIRTDFVLSAEIIVISLGSAAAAAFATQAAVVISIALIMTVGVYGFVALIVKLDDIGLHMVQKQNALSVTIGRGLVAAAPKLMKFLSVLGTAAMFMVGGGIITHGIPVVHHLIEELAHSTEPLGWLTSSVVNGVAGIVVGALVLAVVSLAMKLFKSTKTTA